MGTGNNTYRLSVPTRKEGTSVVVRVWRDANMSIFSFTTTDRLPNVPTACVTVNTWEEKLIHSFSRG